MIEFLISILALIGVPSAIAQVIANLGISGILITFGIVVVKYWSNIRTIVGKLFGFTDATAQTTNTNTATLNTLAEKLDELIRVNERVFGSIVDISKDQKDIIKDQKNVNVGINAILANKAGELNSELVKNLVGIYSGKIHHEIMLWWNERVRMNHILTKTDIVIERYENEMQRVTDRFETQLSKYTVSGMKLSEFSGNGGIGTYYRYIFVNLFGVQYTLAEHEEHTITDVEDFLNACQTELMNLSYEWAENPIIQNRLDKIKEMPKIRDSQQFIKNV